MRQSVQLLVFLLATSIHAGASHADRGTKATLTVMSPAFKANEAIPSEFTCDGAEKTPPLAWGNVPAGTKSIALLVEDPDAPKGTFTHWIVTGLPPRDTELAGPSLPEGAVAAKNDKGTIGYAGPCPPSGTHHYHFRVYALDSMIPAPPAPMTRAEFGKAIDGHVLAAGELVGTYTRQRSMNH